MGGPGILVVLPRRLSAAERTSLRDQIAGVALQDHAFDLDRFHVDDMRSLGGTFVAANATDSRPLAIHVDDPDTDELEPHVRASICAAFGFLPASHVSIGAYCGQEEDHRVLGEMAARIAEMHDGVILFGGLLWKLIDIEPAYQSPSTDWRPIDAQFHKAASSMAGTVVTIVNEEGHCTEHVGDAAFLRAWLAHPRFRMIK